MSQVPPAQRLLAHIARLASRARLALARASGARIEEEVHIGHGADLRLGLAAPRRGELHIGPRCQLGAGAVLHPYGGRIVLGREVHLGPHVVIYGHGGVEIGDDTLVAMHCRILSSEHTVPPLDRRIRWEPDVPKPTRVGRDVWLGAGVTMLGGVTIGDGCVVGAGAVVTRDLPPGSIALGTPARVVGQRPATSV